MSRIINNAINAFDILAHSEKLDFLLQIIRRGDFYGADFVDMLNAIGYNIMAPALDIKKLKEALWLRGYALLTRQELYKLQNDAWANDPKAPRVK